MSLLSNLLQKFNGSRLFRAIIWGNSADYTRWDKIKMVTQAYERNPVVAAIVDNVSELVSAVPVYVEYIGANHKKQTTTNHPILTALDHSDGGRKGVVDFVTKFVMVTGEGYLQKLVYGEGKDATLTGFVVMPSQYTNPIQGSPANPVQGYEYVQNGREVFAKDEVIYVRRASLSEYFHGTSPVTALAEVIDMHNSAITWNKNMAQRGGLPPLLVKMPGVNPEAAQQWKREWMLINGGANNAGAPAIAGGRDTEFLQLNVKPNDAEWSKIIEIGNRLIAMRFRYPSELLNDPSGKTYANVTEATKTLYRDIVLPLAELIYGAISRDCRRYYSDAPYIRIDVDKITALQDDKTKQISAVVQAVGKPVLTQNEGREILEFPASDNPSANELAQTAPTILNAQTPTP